MFVLLNGKFIKEDRMEDKYLVAKTLLECYSHLDDLYNALTKRVDACMESGFYAIFPNEQMRIYERITEYENRKIGLYNMKFLIEECFRKGKSAPISILKEKYINKITKEECMKKYGVSLRTFYRYVKKGIADFTVELEKMGFEKKKILCEFGNEPLFQTTLTKVIREDDREEGGTASTPTPIALQGINSRRTPLLHGGYVHGRYCV